MIVVTRALDQLAKQAVGEGNVAVSGIKTMMDKFRLDPGVSQIAEEVYLVANVDVRNDKLKKQFLEAAAAKHPDVRIVYISKTGKPDLQVGNGIDAVLERPKAEVVADTIYSLIEEVTRKGDVVSAADSVPQEIETFKPQGLAGNEKVIPTDEFGEYINPSELEKIIDEVKNEEAQADPIKLDLSKEIPTQPKEIEQVDVQKSQIVENIKGCNKIADINVLTRELTATNIIKDLVKDSAEYVNIEDKLKVLNEKILSIWADPSIRSTADKLDKMKSILYDKDYFRAKSNTLIEQRVEEIISTLIDKTKDCLNKRLAELNNAILNLNRQPAEGLDYTRLAGITDERANLILELQVMDKNIREIFASANKACLDISSIIAEESANLSDSPLLNANLRLRGDSVVSDKSLDTIINIMSTAEQTSLEFKEAARDLVVMMQKVNKLIDLDREQIAALTQVIQYLQSNNIEDTIIKETMIKKSLRLFIAKPNTGRSVIPYILSKLKSRENYNVLYVDLTGTNKVADYGDDMYTLDDWFNNRYEKEFCGVIGKAVDTTEFAQRLMVALVKAADYYRVINVVLDPEQEAIFKVFAPDVLTINYLTDTSKKSLDFFREYIKTTKYDNVAQRVIINKCDIQIRPIIGRLDLLENCDVHIATIPTIPALAECSLNGVKPYELTTVQEAMREVRKVC